MRIEIILIKMACDSWRSYSLHNSECIIAVQIIGIILRIPDINQGEFSW